MKDSEGGLWIFGLIFLILFLFFVGCLSGSATMKGKTVSKYNECTEYWEQPQDKCIKYALYGKGKLNGK